MKLRWKLLIGMVVLVGAGAFLLFRPDSSLQKAVEQTRQSLRNQGFKTDLSDFNFSTSAEMRARETALTNAAFNAHTMNHTEDPALQAVLWQDKPDLMQPIGEDAAMVVWKQNGVNFGTEVSSFDSGIDIWPALRSVLNERDAEYDAAIEAICAGPIAFDLDASHGNGMLLRHAAAFKQLCRTFGKRAVLELHDGNAAAAWTNVLASTRLVTAWNPEPVEISHLVRFACAAIVFDTTWQALQAQNWSDAQLVQLQNEWESADFFKGFPETAAFSRACAVDSCQQDRQQPMPGIPFKDVVQSPRHALPAVQDYWQQLRYRNYGSYDDENALLLFYRDREVELRRAVEAPNWSEMQRLPGVVNPPTFVSKHSSRAQSILNLKQLTLGAQRMGQGSLSRAANAESHRRLLVAAIALERYHAQHGSYPKTLADLTPQFLKTVPLDFMNGEPLRYRLADRAQVALYSVGLDGVDDGGKSAKRKRGRRPAPEMESPAGGDLVWPRPASPQEVAAELQAQKERQEEQNREAAREHIIRETTQEAERRATVEKLLSMDPPPPSKDEKYRGRPLSEVLRNEKVWGAKKPNLEQLLALRQIVTGEEPQTITFEVPISYDAITNLNNTPEIHESASLQLLVDVEANDTPMMDHGYLQELKRGTNGNCLLIWNTIYDPPGQHALQARFSADVGLQDHFDIRGPVLPYFSSNLFCLDPFYTRFGTRAVLYARLAEPNGIYTIDVQSPSGEHVRTFKGTTTNGVIDVAWDLLDEHGKRYTNDSFNSIFHVTLPDSGRSQTVK